MQSTKQALNPGRRAQMADSISLDSPGPSLCVTIHQVDVIYYATLYLVLTENLFKKYGEIPGAVHRIVVNTGENGKTLGLNLIGSRNATCLPGVFIAGIVPGGPADIDGRMRIGDELLQVNC